MYIYTKSSKICAIRVNINYHSLLTLTCTLRCLQARRSQQALSYKSTWSNGVDSEAFNARALDHKKFTWMYPYWLVPNNRSLSCTYKRFTDVSLNLEAESYPVLLGHTAKPLQAYACYAYPQKSAKSLIALPSLKCPDWRRCPHFRGSFVHISQCSWECT